MEYLRIKLGGRKKSILLKLVESYIKEAEPISSGYLEHFIDSSSATIRNELRELTELGFLEQVHSMGGRIPTSRAYRIYVNELISRLILDRNEVKALYRAFNKVGREMEALIASALEVLSKKSDYMAYATVSSAPSTRVRSVNLIELGETEVVVILVTDVGVAQSKVIRTGVPVRKLMLGLVNEKLNNYLRGKRVQEINLKELKGFLRGIADRIPALFSRLDEVLRTATYPSQRVIFTEAYKLLSQPEFDEANAFREVMATIQDQDCFLEIVEKGQTEREIDAVIGDEAGRDELRNVSILVSSYASENEQLGKLGLVGPKRLDYEGSLPMVFNVAEALSRALADWKKR